MIQPLSTSSGDLIIKIFSTLNSENIPYVVMRNYDGLPETIGHDIDLLVDEEHLERFVRVFYDIIRAEKWSITQKQSRYSFISFIICPDETTGGIQKSLKWDIFAPLTYRGVRWIDSRQILKSRKFYSDLFYIPSKGAESATLLLKDLLHGRGINKRYLKRIQDFCIKDPLEFSSVLLNSFGDETVKRLTRDVCEGKFEAIEDYSSDLRNLLKKRSIKRHIFKFIFGNLLFISGHIRDYIMGRNRIFICFIGPDGSGKSTISALAMESVQDLFEDGRYYHGHFGFLPPLSNLLSHRKKSKKPDNDAGHGNKKKTGRLIAGIIMFYYSVEYLSGFLYLKIRRRICDLIVFDRYFYDYIIQPSPFGINSLFYRTLYLIIPKPDIVFFLKSPAETVYQRKQELPVSEISRQLGICEQIISKEKNSYIVDNTRQRESVVQEIRSKILEVTIKKGQKKYGR